MKNTLLIIFAFLSSSFSLFAQNNGFMGKKNFISADVRFYSPIIYSLLSTNSIGAYNKTSGANFSPKKNILDYGFNFTIGRAMSRNFGMMLQFSTSRYEFAVINSEYSLNTYDFFGGSSYYEILKTNWLKAKTTTIMPILEFSGNSGLLPLGLSHQIGLGFTKNELVEDKYNFLMSTYNVPTFVQKDNLYDYTNDPVKSYAFMYKINLRIPISDFILFNVGFRYNINYFPKLYKSSNSSETKYLMDNSDIRDFMQQKEFRNILSLETGLSFCF